MQEKGKVLIVDDNSKMRETISMWLAEEGFETLLASNGQEGLEILKREPLDIALTDLVMPVMDGLAFVREAKKYDPALSIIVITGNATKDPSSGGGIGCIEDASPLIMNNVICPPMPRHNCGR